MLENGAREVKLFSTDISDWRITFVDTGLNSPDRRAAARVRRFVEDEPMFLANYADVLTNAPLPDMIERFGASNAVASLLAVPPQSSHHVVDIGEDGIITQVTPMQDLRQWENGGYFLLRPQIFDHLHEGEDLVEDALMQRLVPRDACSPTPTRVLVTRRHRQRTCPAGGNVPARELPLDDLGPRTIGPGHGGQPWRRRRSPAATVVPGRCPYRRRGDSCAARAPGQQDVPARLAD